MKNIQQKCIVLSREKFRSVSGCYYLLDKLAFYIIGVNICEKITNAFENNIINKYRNVKYEENSYYLKTKALN